MTGRKTRTSGEVSSLANRIPDWVRLKHRHDCKRCGAAVQAWVRLMWNGLRIGEITFCPVCSPQVSLWVERQTTRLRALPSGPHFTW